MKYCISICCDNINDTIVDLKKALRIADYFEIRFDKLSIDDLDKLYEFRKHKIIITVRNKKNGGFFKGNEQERIQILKKALEFGFAYIDLEIEIPSKTIIEFFLNKKSSKIIISYHNFYETPKNLFSIFKKIKIYEPDIIKIVTTAKMIEDNIRFNSIYDLLDNEKVVFHCMGEFGQISRILGCFAGNEFTYTYFEKSNPTAPNQLSIEILKNDYYLDRIKKFPEVFGLVGNPVAQSKSYILHNFAFSTLKINSVYLNFLVKDLKSFLEKYFYVYSGLSITIPFKEEVRKYLDYEDDFTSLSGAANTVLIIDEKLYGFNTDVVGIQKALKNNKVNIKNKIILVLGAGGAARASAIATYKDAQKLIISNRTINKAKILANEFKCDYCKLDEIENIKPDLIINATSVGMFPNSNESVITSKILKNCTIFDLVYNPVKTKLLKDAESNGCKIISGLDMFLYQAQEQFYLFTNKRFNFENCKKYLLKHF